MFVGVREALFNMCLIEGEVRGENWIKVGVHVIREGFSGTRHQGMITPLMAFG